MSTVYEAEHIPTGALMAIKVLHPSLMQDAEAVARLEREAKLVGTIAHPNICRITDFGRTTDGGPYLVMERLYGETLADRLKRMGALQFDELASILRQVLAALELAHHHGILHRDLKPENIFVLGENKAERLVAKLLDFGVSKCIFGDDPTAQRLTHTGMVMGTPYYMAPEQARGDTQLDRGVDLWAVGVILYECLTGYRPFSAQNYNALLVKILASEPRPISHFFPEMPAEVGQLLRRALAKNRSDRFLEAREFATELEQVQRFCQDFQSTPPLWQSGTHRRATKTSPEGILSVETGMRSAIAHADTVDDDERTQSLPARDRANVPPRIREVALWDDLAEPTIEDRVSNHQYGNTELPVRTGRTAGNWVPAGAHGDRELTDIDDGQCDTEVMVRKALVVESDPAAKVTSRDNDEKPDLEPGPPALAERHSHSDEALTMANTGTSAVSENDESSDVIDEQQD